MRRRPYVVAFDNFSTALCKAESFGTSSHMIEAREQKYEVIAIIDASSRASAASLLRPIQQADRRRHTAQHSAAYTARGTGSTTSDRSSLLGHSFNRANG
jgi:hypothetical protein